MNAHVKIDNLPALQRTVLDLVEEYETKRDAMEAEIEAFSAAIDRIKSAACVQGQYGGSIMSDPRVDERTMKKVLLKSGWMAIYDRLQIDRIASATDKRLFKATLESPPELTFDNAKATFGDYILRPRQHILRGLAEVFVTLDPAYKSHSKVRIGVKGLPKRVIIGAFSGYGSWGQDRFRDMVNALASYRGEPLPEYKELNKVYDLHSYTQARSGEVEFRGLRVIKYKNNNVHVIFPPQTLLDINRALAEFYGEVLPDAEEEGVKPRASTAVAKDLQFYWSPPDVVERALEFAGIYQPRDYARAEWPRYRVLEPSCGDGRIMDEIRKRGHDVLGIEVHPGRAEECRAKGHAVLTANFLDHPPKPEFDYVVMNPPFYGKHYVKHVRHALKFLKPGGALVAILPASAHYDHDDLKGTWEDLPVASFAEAGTNIPTGLLKIYVPK